jgi:serine/threonine-protein kinase
MRRHLEGNPERLPGIPDELWTVIMSCLAQKPRLRPSAAELVAELGDVALATAAAPALPPPPPRPGRPPAEAGSKHPSAVVPPPRAPARRNQVPKWRWARPGPWAALIGGAMVASAVATTAWHLGRADGNPGDTVGGQHATSAPAARPANPPPSAPAGEAVSAPPAVADHRPRGDLPAATAHPARVRATTSPNRSPKPPVVPEKGYGPVQCKNLFAFSFTAPTLAQPCYNLGSKVQIRAQLTAPAGGRATVSVALQDASTGRTIADPHTCSDLVFTENFKQLQCGPATVNPARGHRYVVVMSWQYTRGGQPANGTAKGDEFAW